ncbi:serine hydrolase domain-containing protein [Sandarakinorhabdus sp. AAP62]|uniref:serine hydrolase domain-containing protein n=1 Tax=Sandarakinorhabdus sp. AAP62 TaxID=1248916 RepID=UPI00031AB51D|nr:serine hydrolase domain-containing protein [Sandarakinorhabdus sp. AAP62]
MRTLPAFCLLLASPTEANPLGNPLAALVAGTEARAPQLSGVVGVVADRNRIIRAEAHGLADIAANRPLQADSVIRVASVSKLVVAIAVWRLVEQGRLDPDKDVGQYLGWTLRHPAHKDVPVTLRQLLSHTSGIVDGPGYGFALEERLQDKLTAEHWGPGAPGRRFAYANLNYGIIGSVMEAATGERFDRLMTRLVLAPLRIDAGYNWQGASDAAVARAAVLYRKGSDETAWNPDGPWVPQVDDLKGQRAACPVRSTSNCDLAAYQLGSNGTMFSPQGGLRISIPDLARIGQLLLRGGEVATESGSVRLLKPATVKAMLTPVWQAGGAVPGDDYQGQMLCYGAGPQCLTGRAGATDQPVPGARWWGHLGEAYGLLAGLWVDRTRGRVMAYALTGTSADPFKSPHVASAFSSAEDIIMAELAK